MEFKIKVIIKDTEVVESSLGIDERWLLSSVCRSVFGVKFFICP
jgi:hypothetical protein